MELLIFALLYAVALICCGIVGAVAVGLYHFRAEQRRRVHQLISPIEVEAASMAALVESVGRIELGLSADKASAPKVKFENTLALSQMVLGRLFLFDTLLDRMRRVHGGPFLGPLMARVGWPRDRTSHLTHTFLHITGIASAKPAFTEELWIDPREPGDRDLSLQDLKQLIRPSWSRSRRPDFYRLLIKSYCQDLPKSDAARGTMSFRQIDSDSRRSRTELVELLRRFERLSSDASGFSQAFRREARGESFDEILLRPVAPQGLLFLVHLFSFLRRELEIMPVYRTEALRAAAERKLATAFGKFCRDVDRELQAASDQIRDADWEIVIRYANRIIEEFYRFAGRSETLPFVELVRRECFRDYSQCGSPSQIIGMGEAIKGALAAEREQVPHRSELAEQGHGIRLCFREAEGVWVWDMARVLEPTAEAAVVLESVIVWLLDSVDHTSYDRVVGIARSGIIPAALISLIIRKPLTITELDATFDQQPLPSSFESLLLVDDCVQSGYSLSLAAMMLGRTWLRVRGVRGLTMAMHDGVPGQGGQSLPGVTAPRRLFENLVACARYRYDYVDGKIRPQITRDQSAEVSDEARANLRSLLTNQISSIPLLDTGQVKTELRQLCESEGFLKLDLLFDYPITLLKIGKYLASKLEADAIDVVVGASPNTIPIITAIALSQRFGGGSGRAVRVLFAPRNREIIGLDAVQAGQRVALLDLSVRTRGRLTDLRASLYGSRGPAINVVKAYVLADEQPTLKGDLPIEAILTVQQS